MDGMIRNSFGFKWQCNARADKIDDAILTLMKKAGCHTVSIGCESAVPEILKRMRKNVTVEQLEAAVKLVKEKKMRVLMYLTFGLEGETEATMRRTFDFARRLRPEFVTFGIVVPAPGTPFYESMKGKGHLKEKERHWQDPTALPSFSYPHLAGDEILAFTRKAYRDYYLSPGYILRRLSSLQSFTEFAASASNAFELLKRYVFGARR
jgi:radical SAM superfamily enzyme YgiQ (UPF0313 family)